MDLIRSKAHIQNAKVCTNYVRGNDFVAVTCLTPSSKVCCSYMFGTSILHRAYLWRLTQKNNFIVLHLQTYLHVFSCFSTNVFETLVIYEGGTRHLWFKAFQDVRTWMMWKWVAARMPDQHWYSQMRMKHYLQCHIPHSTAQPLDPEESLHLERW